MPVRYSLRFVHSEFAEKVLTFRRKTLTVRMYGFVVVVKYLTGTKIRNRLLRKGTNFSLELDCTDLC